MSKKRKWFLIDTDLPDLVVWCEGQNRADARARHRRDSSEEPRRMRLWRNKAKQRGYRFRIT